MLCTDALRDSRPLTKSIAVWMSEEGNVCLTLQFNLGHDNENKTNPSENEGESTHKSKS